MDWNKEIKLEDISKAIRKNPIGVFFILLAVVIAFTIAVAVNLNKPNVPASASSAPDGVSVDALPQTERKSESRSAISFDKNPFESDVLSNAYLTGVMSVEGGYKTAIIVSDYGSFVVRQHDQIGKTKWVVKEITDSEVTVKNGDAELKIAFKDDKDED